MADNKHLRIPVELHERLKAHCERRGVPLTDYASQAIREAMGLDGDGPTRTIQLPVSPRLAASLIQFCRERSLNTAAVVDAALVAAMTRERRKLLPRIPSGAVRPEPWTLPAFYERPRFAPRRLETRPTTADAEPPATEKA